MDKIRIFLEIGKKKAACGAVDWPGLFRGDKDENSAIQALLGCAPGYARILAEGQVEFPIPSSVEQLNVTDRNEGNASTDFGGFGVILASDRDPLSEAEFQRQLAVLNACWKAFDQAVEQAKGKELRKGPRGGGRSLEKILDHVNQSDRAYLSRIAWKHSPVEGLPAREGMNQTRLAIHDALEMAMRAGLPEKGPRGGVIWPLRYFIRTVAYHLTDHIWEIEDRLE